MNIKNIYLHAPHQLFTFYSILAIITFVSSRQSFHVTTIHDYFDRSIIIFSFYLTLSQRQKITRFPRGCLFFQALRRKVLLVSTSSAVLRKFQTKSNLRLFRRGSAASSREFPPRFAYSLRTNSWRTAANPADKTLQRHPRFATPRKLYEEVRRRNCCQDRETVVTTIIGIYYTMYSMQEEHVIIRVNYFMHNVRNITCKCITSRGRL